MPWCAYPVHGTTCSTVQLGTAPQNYACMLLYQVGVQLFLLAAKRLSVDEYWLKAGRQAGIVSWGKDECAGGLHLLRSTCLHASMPPCRPEYGDLAARAAYWQESISTNRVRIHPR